MPEDFLIVYEEEDPGDAVQDRLVLDIDAMRGQFLGELDVETDIDLQLSNTSNVWGLVGIIASGVGAVIALVAMILFGINYPDAWYDSNEELVSDPIQSTVGILAVFSAVILIVGTILTLYGRRVGARGLLREVHIVQKEERTASASIDHSFDMSAEYSDAPAPEPSADSWDGYEEDTWK